MRKTMTVAVLAALALTGCSQHDVDREAWRTDLAAAGVTAPDLDRLEPLVREDCEKDADDLELLVAVAKDSDGDDAVEQMRVNFHNVCPDQQSKLEDAISGLNESTSNVQEACDTPAGQRTEEQRMLAEAMACD